MPEAFNEQRITDIIGESIATKQRLAEECASDIATSGSVLAACAAANKRIFFCGNGGSAADSQHLAAELVVRLRSGIERRAIAALALTVDTSVLTAGGNDYGFDQVFARQVRGFGRPGDVLVALSTSGNSPNILAALQEARDCGVASLALLGRDGGHARGLASEELIVPGTATARIQEGHKFLLHVLCEMVEGRLQTGA
jgi:D-sedoheptulose 7-phosphate isomerase